MRSNNICQRFFGTPLHVLPLLSLHLILPPDIATAHHAGATYDMDNIVEIEGEITSVSWRNPHIRMTLVRVNEEGVSESWSLEGGPLNLMQRMGVSTDDISQGDQVTLAGAIDRNGRARMFVFNALTEDGRELLLSPTHPLRWSTGEVNEHSENSSVAERSVEKPEDIFRTWSRILNTDAEWSALFTEAAQTAQAQWDPVRDDQTLRCVGPGMVEAMLTPFPIKISRDGDDIAIQLEAFDANRKVIMNNMVDSADVEVTKMGYSTGRWEGETLVVTTSRVGWPFLNDTGIPQSGSAIIVERYTMNGDKTRMHWEATIKDPMYLAEPARVTQQYEWIPGEQIQPYNCEYSEAEL